MAQYKVLNLVTCVKDYVWLCNSYVWWNDDDD